MAENQMLGFINCPHCTKEIKLKESKKGKAYYTCDDCGQFFARTPGADAALRALARPAKKEGGKVRAPAETKPISEAETQKKPEKEVTNSGAENPAGRKKSIFDSI
ncbi:MAG: hypothetical protein HY884_05390 [Deltaproteobacteria bacterium]|nr:hypothetical protein [Deltaproteobacteria bacterium]